MKLVLPEFRQYCHNSGKTAAVLAILPETAYTLMLIYALMESFLSLKYIFYFRSCFLMLLPIIKDLFIKGFNLDSHIAVLNTLVKKVGGVPDLINKE